LAIGWRVPDPHADLRGHIAHIVLAEMLGGEMGRLMSPLMANGLVSGLTAGVSLTDQELTAFDPTGMVVTAYLMPGVEPDHVLEVVHREIEQLAGSGPSDAE